MLIESKGYVIMNREQMSFLTREEEFSDDIDEAEIIPEYAEAKEDVDSLNSDEPNKYEVIRYLKTIWLEQPSEIIEADSECCDGGCCHQNLNDVIGRQMTISDLIIDSKEDTDE